MYAAADTMPPPTLAVHVMRAACRCGSGALGAAVAGLVAGFIPIVGADWALPAPAEPCGL
jgi:hypothetical protein